MSPQLLLEEVDSLRTELADTLVEMADRQDEITTLKEAMAKVAIERGACSDVQGENSGGVAQEAKAEPLLQCH